MSDFPEFDARYQTVLIKDKEDRFEQLAAQANFNVYHSDIWRGTGRKFAELIVVECMDVFGRDLPEPGDGRMLEVIDRICNVAEHFGVDNGR